MAYSIPPLQTVSTGFVAAIVGFFSSFPIVLQGLTSVGASAGQAASGLLFAALAMGLAGILLSLWKKDPISVAWSTPGVALLAVTPATAGGFNEAVFGFLVAAALTILAGLWRPLNRLITRIPGPLAQAMLAGVLIPLCLVPFQALAAAPMVAVPVVLTWFVVGLVNRLYAVPAAVVVALALVGWSTGFAIPMPDHILTRPVLVMPEAGVAGVLTIGIPLFIVTMATQNIPGIAVLRSFGYTPPPGPLLTTVGVASGVSAVFGSAAICLAAITAALCANPDSHPDPRQRYWSAVTTGVFYCLFGLFAAVITAVAAAAPPLLLGTLAGVALIGVFTSSATSALADETYREAAAVTFLTTASGMAVFGLSAAVWGLVLGGIVHLLKSRLRRA
ncbi:benzoate/H(+) symporter BenE family transporter [Marivita sp. S6314]|uniref:benzoate/H(+) symporter BenE family transporter n=1 Tax=Marivita sp. S6314 TaxID=2926406 RepID=UPI0032B3022F|nr:benzoate/H(+) symporter BenE family transporter [Marivita sp. S6314]